MRIKKNSFVKSLVLGISGGQDSTLCGKLCQMAMTELREETGEDYKFIAVRLPYGTQFDEDDCNDALKFIGPDKVYTVNIKKAVDASVESLREAVYLRSYGQKNPLIEYKLEGSDIFNAMIDEIRFDMASLVVRVKINTEEGERRERIRVIGGNASHSSVSTFQNTNMQGRNTPDKVQIVRSMPKVGRNDPCPCGSGKKYKHCCGRNT